jgi:integrase
VFQHCKPWNPKVPAYGRFWVDVPGRYRQRKTVSLGVCRTASIAKQKLREHIESTGINSEQSFTTKTAPAITFRAQAERWIASLSTRRRKPVKPATIWGWQHALDKWLLPNLGDTALSDVGNAALKELIDKMAAARLSAQSIVNYTKVVKMVVASAVNAEGEEIHPRKWNHNFIGMPILKREEQHRPTATEAELGKILATAQKRYCVLFASLAGTGLRIGEALALKPTDFSPDFRVLFVRQAFGTVRNRHRKHPTLYVWLTSRSRWPDSYANTLPVNPVIYLPQRADSHSNNVTSFGRSTLPARKLASMLFVDSVRRHCVERACLRI